MMVVQTAAQEGHCDVIRLLYNMRSDMNRSTNDGCIPMWQLIGYLMIWVPI